MSEDVALHSITTKKQQMSLRVSYITTTELFL